MVNNVTCPFVSAAMLMTIASGRIVGSFQALPIRRRLQTFDCISSHVSTFYFTRKGACRVTQARRSGTLAFMVDFDSDDFQTDEDLFAALERDDRFQSRSNSPDFEGEAFNDHQNYQISDQFNANQFGKREFDPRNRVDMIEGTEYHEKGEMRADPFIRPSGRPSVPVLGPFLMQPPLLVGDQYVMKNPTPMQWKTLEEALYLHETLGEDSVVHAAPLVALIDEVTADMSVPVPGEKRKKGRYATLAAVIGMNMDGPRDDCEVLEDDDMMQDGCTIRLIGIGRAVITDYYNRLPISDDEYFDNDDYGTEGFSSSDYLANNPPIVMGEFVFLSDGGSSSMGGNAKGSSYPGMTMKLPSESNTNFQVSLQRSRFLDGAGIGSTGSSPVAAISKLSQISNQLGWMHQTRQNLVNQIKAAYGRLEQYYENDALEVVDRDNLMNFLFSDENLFQKTVVQNGESILYLDNYGLNYFGALAPLMSMAYEAKDQLRPFYSFEHQEREEWEYEVQSYVSWKVLSDVVSPRDMAWSLLCTSTIERLQKAYNVMSEHRIALQTVADRLRDALWDYGDDAADIF